MKEAAEGVNLYPDGGAVALREQLATFHGFTPENIVQGAGSSELIELLAHICLESDGELIAAKYSFTLYPLMTQLFGAKYTEVENKADFTHDTAAMLRAITPNTRLIFITNPTNPLGTMIGQEEIDDFMRAVPEHVLVVFDEAYIHFAEEQPDTLKYVREMWRYCVPFRKLTGWRVYASAMRSRRQQLPSCCTKRDHRSTQAASRRRQRRLPCAMRNI